MRVFDAYRSKRRTTEAGGVLLGRVYESEIVIEVATRPSAADRAGAFFFDRSTHVCQEHVNQAWSTSGGEQIYLGEWHSHPAEVAEPSGRDRAMILNNLRDAKMEIDFLFLIVIGWVFDWVGIAKRASLRQLLPIRIRLPARAGLSIDLILELSRRRHRHPAGRKQ
jgi:integrative and conjugative element protein (TIGR02256 family)